MKKIFLLTLAIVVACAAAMAVPAKPGLNTVTMSDGTTLQVQVLGDEWSHSLATADGLTIAFGDDGLFYYVVSGNITNVRAHDVTNRSASELSFVNANKEQMTMAALHESKAQAGKLRSVQPRSTSLKATQVPNNGSPRVPIILVQYTDKSMSHTKNQFEAQYNTNAKSVFNYFKDQSNGLYTPQFDIYGIYTLPGNRATYGANNSSGDDVGVAKMVGDAITKAGNEINWSQYDNNGDGYADVCIVVYAGVGEAQASYTVPNAVWPCQWSLSSGAYYGDGPGAITRNGVTIDKFAVFNEISGSSDSGTTMDGVGTFCHEFSHCLGLPDFYETTYNHGYFGMSYWSLMDTGCYNGGSISGDTPIGYSAYEKNFMGWLNYIIPTENTFYTLPVFNSKVAENDQAVKITALNNNEYWILENRKKQNWDYYIQDEGILITHFTYVADRWSANTVNNQSVQLATIMPADNSLSTNNLNKDLYGETNHAFGPNTSPAMKANMSASGSLSNSTGGAGTVNKPVTEINLNSDGTASFWYIKGEVQNPTINVSTNSLAFEGYVGDTYTKTFTVTGINLTGNISITKQGSNVYSVSPTSITAANAAGGVQVTVTYTPTAAGNTNATLTLASTGAQNVTINLTGTAQAKTPTITVNPASLSLAATLSSTVTKTINVSGQFLSNNVTVTLNDNNGVFSVTPTTITAANANNGTQVTVSFSSANEGNFNGSLTFASNGAESKTVQLTASAAEGGNASDPYLNIAKYNTIGQAGATVSGMSAIYKYNEYPSDACAWLTVSNYGARKADANQNWINCEGQDKSESETWNATDIFLGSSSYFTGTAYYANWNEAYQNYYVTNCSQVKQYSYNIQSSNYTGNVYPVRMEIYECTLNADGTLTEGTTMVDNKQSQLTNAAEVVTSMDLDPSKIYKVRIYNDYSRLYEIGFKTPIQGVDTPVATDATEVGANEFTAHWTACDDAQSYTLRVMPKPEITTELLLTEGFSKFTSNGTANIGGSLNNYMDNTGWTGSNVFTAIGGIRLGSGSTKGTLTSPSLDLAGSNGKVSIVYKAKTYNTDTNCNMTITCGSSTATVTVPNSTEAEYTQVLDCNTAAGQNVTFATTANRKRVIITSIEIYSGDITAGDAKAEGEMLFPGITGTQYTVTGLLPLTTYIYDVKAIYPAVESNWSNLIEVTTTELTTVAGDVNGDGQVTSFDITALYNYLLAGDMSDIVNGDQNGDGQITSADVTEVYSILLNAKK
ncbi:MAG: M6 family metalloprotease domain-containing protein [Muribaculaceae bacterium]|nr:M6 family metalloprotease domain-containing protein [Muribaculaceae bacterium]